MSRVRIILMGAVLCGKLAGVAGAENNKLPIAYVYLKYQLVRQGVEKDFVLKTFADSRNRFLPQVVKKIAYLRKERAADYSHFLKTEVVARGRSYLNEHRRDLNRAQGTWEDLCLPLKGGTWSRGNEVCGRGTGSWINP